MYTPIFSALLHLPFQKVEKTLNPYDYTLRISPDLETKAAPLEYSDGTLHLNNQKAKPELAVYNNNNLTAILYNSNLSRSKTGQISIAFSNHIETLRNKPKSRFAQLKRLTESGELS